MSNRAIRNSKLNFDTLQKDKYSFIEALNTNLNDKHTIWTFLQDAQNHDVEVGGIPAHEYRGNVANLTQGYQYGNLTDILTYTFNFMLTETLEKEFGSHRSTILDNLKIMRNMLKKDSNIRWNLDPSHPDYNAKFEKAYEVIWKTLNTIGENVSLKFNPTNGNYSRNIIQTRWYANMFNGGTADSSLEDMINHPATYLFNINVGYMIPYVSYDSYYTKTDVIDLKTITNFTDAEMGAMVSSMKSKNARLHLEIAAMHEFALANPQVVSMAQSWTSRRRSDWCYFKQHHNDISKKNTIACGIISDLFGKHTPTFTGLKADWEAKMKQITDDIKKAEPALEKALKQMNEDLEKTHENMVEAITEKLNDMLTNGNANDESDALTLIANRAGIQAHHLHQVHVVHYYSLTNQTTLNVYLHWNALIQYDIDLKGIVLTDAQQGIIATRYNERRKEMINGHSHRCAQLARQIANETTRHDEHMKSMQEAFIAFTNTV